MSTPGAYARSAAEQRVHARIPRQVQVLLRTKGTPAPPFEGSSSNISKGGMFVHSPQPLEVGTALLATLFPQEVPALAVSARVVHVEQSVGFGCIFTRVPIASSLRLNLLLGRSGGLPPVSGTIERAN